MKSIKYAPINIEFDKIFEDSRGIIAQLPWRTCFKDVLYITCTKGAIRANHWHAIDFHLSILLKGEMEYYERPLGSEEKPIRQLYYTGDWFFTKPRVEHAMKFLTTSYFLAFSKLSRNRKNYLTDTTKLNFDLTKI